MDGWPRIRLEKTWGIQSQALLIEARSQACRRSSSPSFINWSVEGTGSAWATSSLLQRQEFGCRSWAVSMPSAWHRSSPWHGRLLSDYGAEERPRSWILCRLRFFLPRRSGSFGSWKKRAFFRLSVEGGPKGRSHLQKLLKRGYTRSRKYHRAAGNSATANSTAFLVLRHERLCLLEVNIPTASRTTYGTD